MHSWELTTNLANKVVCCHAEVAKDSVDALQIVFSAMWLAEKKFLSRK